MLPLRGGVLMLDAVAAHGDWILAFTNIVFSVVLAPTVWHQWRVKASTMPLTTSVATFVALGIILVLWLANQWWLALATDAANMSLWAVVAGQRIIYGAPADQEALRDAAMWAVKNFEEWSDGPNWAGEPFEYLAASVDNLRAALEEGR